MTTNVDRIDRILRIVAGVAIASLFLFQDNPDRWWILVWLIPLWGWFIRWHPVCPPSVYKQQKDRRAH
jgi:steroid 5-alpha reductase family enzyme